MSELALMSDCISCSHVRFLNKKYDIYNNINFNNQLKVNNTNNFNITNNPERVSFLNTLNTNKKSCNYSFENIPPILTKTDKEDKTWENQFKTHIFCSCYYRICSIFNTIIKYLYTFFCYYS